LALKSIAKSEIPCKAASLC
jgi:hypothetical protein